MPDLNTNTSTQETSATADSVASAPIPEEWCQALEFSPFLTQLLTERSHDEHHCTWLRALCANWRQPLSAELLQSVMIACDDDASCKYALRLLRKYAIAHIALRDLADVADLAEVVGSMTLLADFTTNLALRFCHQQLSNIYGEPLDNQGLAQKLLIIGMGKLGGGELNVSSDVDYIFIYPEDGETAGPKVIDNFEFFTRLGKKVIALLGEVTEDGQVFRVDMRLRPNGDSGPLVCSLDALEAYLISQGREWERYAWIKSRVMNDADNMQLNWQQTLFKIVQPFVFRKYLDFGAIHAMRDLHAQIRREVLRKDRLNNIKLGPGGIREIEFIAQVFQLIRGGRDHTLQVRQTLRVLDLLATKGILQQQNVEQLQAAYIFLRRLEHRLQYVFDQQTHTLPSDAKQQQAIAGSMGYEDWSAMLTVLDQHRALVGHEFDAIFANPGDCDSPCAALWMGGLDTQQAHELLEKLGFADPEGILARLKQAKHSARLRHLAESTLQRLDAIVPHFIQAAKAAQEPDIALIRGLDLLENISRRGAYLAMLQQFPQSLSKIADLLSASSWAADYLIQHPILLDELLMTQPIGDIHQLREQLIERLAQHHQDMEREMDVMREFHHAQVFRILAQDLAGTITLEHVSDLLSELADLILEQTLLCCWSRVAKRHCPEPKFAIIAYGKLGGKELGYGSDLDLVYLFDDDHADAQTNYGRLAQRLTTWLGSTTSAGILFETDCRLRPNGDAGLLVNSLESFKHYAQENAWLWEIQALTRARAATGDPETCQKFEQVRRQILSQVRDAQQVKTEIVAMRQKMRDNLASSRSAAARGEFNLKHDSGGIIDVEFIVQYLILCHAHQHPVLLDNLGNIALLGICGQLGLIPADLAEDCQNAYRSYRLIQHQHRLNDHTSKPLLRSAVDEHIRVVTALWKILFE